MRLEPQIARRVVDVAGTRVEELFGNPKALRYIQSDDSDSYFGREACPCDTCRSRAFIELYDAR